MKLNLKKALTFSTLTTIVTLPYTANAVEKSQETTNSDATKSSYSIRPYLGFKTGASFYNFDLDDCNSSSDCKVDSKGVYTINPYIGLQIPITNIVALDFDVEYFWHSNANLKYDTQTTKDKTKIKMMGGTANFYAHFLPTESLQPYVGFGLGFSDLKTTVRSSNKKKYQEDYKNFTYQLSMGAMYTITQNLLADMTFRYSNYGDAVKHVYTQKLEIQSFDLMLGLRYQF